ncbi:MAG TPA: molybdopterin-dependent oxidoreductase [Candidatus Acidoferrum sp.]|nr:molybdopterin-dependent oxidoreductase [Candidatus Acidoferrum sp.]
MTTEDDRRAWSRRGFLRAAAVAGTGALFSSRLAALAAEATVNLPFENGQRRLATFPQKRPLILLTMRPPQLETPFSVFNESVFTPNDAFFVRYHLAQIPTAIDPDEFRLTVQGKVNSPLTLSLAELKTKFEPVEIAAVNQCSGNGRGFSNPRVAGGQLGNGAMGNALWKGARLRDVLNKAGLAADALQVSFNGLDQPVIEKTPDFVKALEVDHALSPDVLLAYEMNSADLPMLNGYPLKLIVPGYYGTYWVKHVNQITVLDTPFQGFWMSSAYRIPNNLCGCVEPGTSPASTRPIARLNVRSFVTSLAEGDKLQVGRPLTVRGIAFDGGYGIDAVWFSEDGGKTLRATTLGRDYGKYGFREWSIPFTPTRAGTYELSARAANRIGQTQPLAALWNPAGYMRNVVETMRVTAS